MDTGHTVDTDTGQAGVEPGARDISVTGVGGQRVLAQIYVSQIGQS